MREALRFVKNSHFAAILAILAAWPLAAQEPDLIANLPPSNGPVQIKAGLYYIDISEIDGATETFAATAYLDLEWKDARLQLKDPDSNKLRLFTPDTIWTPAVDIVNAQKLEDQEPPMCTVTSDGTVYFARRIVVHLNTQMDLRRFPFDRQQLKFVIESSRYGSGQLVFIPDPDQSGIGKDIVSRGWDYRPLQWSVLDNPFAQTGQTYSRLIFAFDARRNPVFMLCKIVFPTAVFVLLTWCIYWMRVEDFQTALLVSITILLTAVAFGNVADPLLPRLGYRTWLDQFQFGSFIFIVATVIETIFVHSLHLGGNSDRAIKVRRLLRLIYPLAYLLFCAILFLVAFV